MSTNTLYRTVPARMLMVLALVVPGTASAGKVVLAPLLVDATINAKQRLAVHQLIASELDFAPEVDGVVDLDVAPPTLDDACIAAAKCLGGIATANGGEQMITGKLSSGGDTFVLDLVFFDGAQIARRKTFTVPQDPTALANSMTPVVRELLTGAGVQQKAATTASKTDFDDEEDLSVGAGVAMGDGLVDVADDEPMVAAAVPATKKPAPLPAPVESGKKGSKDDQRRLAAASAATGLAAGVAAGAAGAGVSGAASGASSAPATAARTAAPPPAAPPPAPADEDLAKMISFGGSVNDITAEDISMINFGPPPGVAAPAPATPAPVVVQRPASGTSDTRLAEEEAELENLTDLDEGSKARSRSPSPGGGSGPKTSSGGASGDLGHVVQFTVRGGYSRYYNFDFFTGGPEVGVAVAGGLHLVAGVELYAVERVLPPELQLETGIYSQWNFIFPANLGAVYKFPLGMAQPYVGADTIFVQYYKDDIGADWAVGARVRAGVDLMMIPNFGFNLNLAVGGWSGQNWGLIEQGVGKAGFLPQVSAGTVVAF